MQRQVNFLLKYVVGTFLCGQFHIITANIRSMDHLVTRYTDIEAVRKFQFFFNGQKTLLEKLVNMAKVVNISRSDLQNYEPRAEAQGYPSHFCLLAHYGDAPQIAAAIAVNFPPFGEMCANIADALKENCSLKEEDADFLRFFEICDLDEGAVKLVIEAYAASKKGKQTPLDYKEIQRAVRLLQAYEDMLMASVYSQV